MKAKNLDKMRESVVTENVHFGQKFVGAFLSTSYQKLSPEENPLERADIIMLDGALYVRVCNDPRHIKGQAHKRFLVSSKCAVIQAELKYARFRFFSYHTFKEMAMKFPALKLFVENSNIRNAFELAEHFEGATISVSFDYNKYLDKAGWEDNTIFPRYANMMGDLNRLSNKDAWEIKKSLKQ